MSDKTKTFSTRIKSKRDTSANWESANPVLLNGEKIIVDTAAGEVREKIGDGVKTYSQLPFTDEKIRGLITEKADEVELERLKYYGDKDIIPSDSSYFTVNETGETITGLTTTGRKQTELVIPYEINGVEITTFYSGVGYDEPQSILAGSSVTKVVVPNSVTTFGRGAFYMCSLLTSINIPNNVISIGDYVFYGCSSLTSINIPNSVTSIGEGAFQGCSALTSIEIPDSVTSIGVGAFQYCYALTSIEIGNSVTSIGVWTFSGCTNLTIYCEQGSYAETYAKTNNIPVMYTDISKTTLDAKANAADVYTKTEVDSKISNVYEIKGNSTVANLPTNPDIGDVYNITDSGTITGTEIVLSTGDNVVYTSEGWDKLAATVDLSSYQEKLIFDTTPTEGSTNPVTSGGIKEYIIEATAEDIDNWIGNSDTTSVVGEATAGNAIVGI